MPSYKDNKGKWFVKFQYKDYTGKSKQKLKRGFKTKKEADIFEREFLHTQQYQPDMPFNAFVEIYKRDKYPQLRENSIRTKEQHQKIILKFFNDKPVKSITSLDINKFYNYLLGMGYSNKYMEGIRVELSSIFNHAVKYYNLNKNPVSVTSKPVNPNEKQKHMKYWTFEEFTKVIKLVDDERAKLALNILYFSGMRKGEMYALTYKDIDFDNNTISINKSFQRIKKKNIITPTKTYNTRVVKMPDYVINEIKEYQKKEYEKEGVVIRWGFRLLSNAIKKACNQLKDVEPIHVHGLRHSNASYLISKGVNVVLISKRLGHKDVSMTLNTYSHFFPDDEINVIKEVEEDIKNYL